MILEHLRRQLVRPRFLLFAIAAALLLVLPKYGPRYVKFHHRLSTCTERVSIRIMSGEELIRSSSQVVRGKSYLEHEALLPRDPYRVSFEVECKDGSTRVRTEPLETEDEVDIDLSRDCPC